MEYGREETLDAAFVKIDSTPAAPLDFYLQQYWRQMVAGVIKPQPDQWLRIFVPDYGKLRAGICR